MLTVTTTLNDRQLRHIAGEAVMCEIYDRFSLSAIKFSGLDTKELVDAMIQDRYFLAQVADGVRKHGNDFLDDPLDYTEFHCKVLEQVSDWVAECEDIVALSEHSVALERALAIVRQSGYTVKAP